jgi:LacI family transcriptional regulator
MFSVDKMYLSGMSLPRAKATLKHISERLDLSISTVSRALKDHPDIAEQTKRKVRELAELMEYEPNAFAIQLRTNASRLIGVIVPEISGFFYHSFIAGLEEEARAWGYSLMILQSGNDPEREAANLRLCRLNRAAGVLAAITSATTDLGQFERTVESGIPVVFFDKVPEGRDFPTVTMSDPEAARLAAEAILQAGMRNVLAIFGDIGLSITRKRLTSFREVFAAADGEGWLTLTHAGSREEARQLTLEGLSAHGQRPDCLFAMSDEILAGSIKAVQQSGLRISDDISLIGISTGFIPSLFEPEISYIQTDGVSLGRKSFEILHRCLSGNPPVGEWTVNVRLVPGASLGRKV